MSDEISELKKALRLILECKFRMQHPESGWRFSFGCDNETISRWEKLSEFNSP